MLNRVEWLKLGLLLVVVVARTPTSYVVTDPSFASQNVTLKFPRKVVNEAQKLTRRV